MTNIQKNITDPLFEVSEKIYLIAGAGGGIGSVLAKALYERGAKLILFDIDEASLKRLKKTIPEALIHKGNINDQESLSRLMQLVQDRFGYIDGAINAAGLLPISAAATFDEAVFRECIDINLTAAFFFSKTVTEFMNESGGRIVHISSVSSVVSNNEYAAYASSKAGLSQLVRVLAREWAPRNILVNAIGPALTDTPLTQDYLSEPEFRNNAISAIPMGRLGEADDLVGPMLMLLSQAGKFITGQTIYVDGGRTLV